MLKSKIFFTIFLLCLGSGLFAQYDFSKVDEWLIENTDLMGGRSILMIYKDRNIIYSKAVNNMNRRQQWISRTVAKRTHEDYSDAGYTPSTKQLIASCSKWYSAALVMTFADEGKLKLTDTVGQYLPVLSQNGKGNITIGECLSHLTGIKEPPIRESLREMSNISSMDEAIDHIAKMPMEGKPGKTFHYSNAGLQIAAAVIEKISGESFERLFAERIAQPLNMKNSDFGKGKVAMPAGGGRSTADDYMHFLEMILANGVYNGRRILSERSVQEMQVNRIGKDVRIAYSPAEAKDFGYGYGEWVMETSDQHHLSTAVTSPGLFGSFPWVDNKRHYCAFLMTFYIKNEGRNERYRKLKSLIDDVVK